MRTDHLPIITKRSCLARKGKEQHPIPKTIDCGRKIGRKNATLLFRAVPDKYFGVWSKERIGSSLLVVFELSLPLDSAKAKIEQQYSIL
jgi:hypothetical protein